MRAVIAETYERIHRSNLIGMGIVPLQYPDGESAESLGLTGREEFAVEGLENGEASEVQVTAKPDDGEPVVFTARVRLDTPRERDYLRHGGILLYALRKLAASPRSPSARSARAHGEAADALVGEQLAVAGADDLVDVDGDVRPSSVKRSGLTRGRSSRTAAPSTRTSACPGRVRPRSHSASRRPGA